MVSFSPQKTISLLSFLLAEQIDLFLILMETENGDTMIFLVLIFTRKLPLIFEATHSWQACFHALLSLFFGGHIPKYLYQPFFLSFSQING